MVFGTVVIINLRLFGVFETPGVRPPDTFGIIGGTARFGDRRVLFLS